MSYLIRDSFYITNHNASDYLRWTLHRPCRHYQKKTNLNYSFLILREVTLGTIWCLSRKLLQRSRWDWSLKVNEQKLHMLKQQKLNTHINGLYYLRSDKVTELVQWQGLQRRRFPLWNFIEAISNCHILWIYYKDRDFKSVLIKMWHCNWWLHRW